MRETPTQKIWREQLQQLEVFLRSWQRHVNIQLTTDQQARVYDLFALWRLNNDLPQNLDDYALALGALLCSRQEQIGLFDDCWQNFSQRLEDSAESSGLAPERERSGNKDKPARLANEGWYASLITRLKKRYRRVIAVFFAVLLAVVIGLSQYLQSSPGNQIIDSKTVIVKPPLVPKKGTGSVKKISSEIPLLQTVPRREPPPVLTLNQQEKSDLWRAGYLVIGAAGLLWLVLVALLFWARRVLFEQARSRADQIAYNVVAESYGNTLFPGFNSNLAKLRFVATGQTKINWPSSVKATARAAGFPSLIRRQHKRRGDYVLISDSRHLRDQAAWLIRQIKEQLKSAQIRVHFYDFDRHPEWLWVAGNRMQKPLPFDQVIAAHSGSRVLIVVDHQLLFYRLSEEIQDWAKSLQHRDHALLALLTSPEPQQAIHLKTQGNAFRVMEQQDDLGALLSEAKVQTQPNSFFHQEFDQGWCGSTIVGDPDQPIDWLETRVGDEGMRLLAAMAMYPKLHGELSYTLFEVLSRSDCEKPLQSAALLKTMTLPWCRQGWLPQWLREALLHWQQRNYPKDYQQLVAFFQALFDSKEKINGRRIALDAVPSPSFWFIYWLKQQLIGSKHDSPLRDAIFTRVLLTPRVNNELSFVARKMKEFPEQVIRIGLPLVQACLLAALLPGVVWTMWHSYGESFYGRYLLEQKKVSFAQHTVTLRYHPDAAGLLEPMGVGLSAAGFGVAYLQDDSVKQNRIDAPSRIAAEIGQVAGYMSWGESYPVFNQEGTVTVQIRALPRTGTVFQDSEPQVPFLQTAYANTIQWRQADSQTLANDPSKPTIAGTIQPILPKMVQIPAGKFMMGSPGTEQGRDTDEGPRHKVSVPTFQMAETELTFDQWQRCVDAGECPEADDEGWGRGNRPVINVSWKGAQKYIKWLNANTKSGGYRLPTEAEWEYAARAGSQSAYFWADKVQCEYANGADQTAKASGQFPEDREYAACKDGYIHTAPVTAFKSNAFVLRNMSGNVWEWVEDCWHENYQNAPTDGSAWLEINGGDCSRRSIRGGSWSNRPALLRSANRSWLRADGAFINAGFRLARTP